MSSSGFMVVDSSSFISNTASGSGGGILAGGRLDIASSRFVNNTALTSQGGAVSCFALQDSRPSVAVVNSSFVGNSAVVGGGISVALVGSKPGTLSPLTVAQVS